MKQSPLDLIEEGIRNADWQIVIDGYEKMTGIRMDLPTSKNDSVILCKIKSLLLDTDNINSEEEVKDIKPPKASKKTYTKNVVKKNKSESVEDLVKDIISEDIDGDIDYTEGYIGLKTGPVSGKGRSLNLITDHLEDDDQIRFNQKTKKSKTVRKPYKPSIVKCTECDAKFDFNKEYPMGTINNDDDLICNKCKCKR